VFGAIYMGQAYFGQAYGADADPPQPFMVYTRKPMKVSVR